MSKNNEVGFINKTMIKINKIEPKIGFIGMGQTILEDLNFAKIGTL